MVSIQLRKKTRMMRSSRRRTRSKINRMKIPSLSLRSQRMKNRNLPKVKSNSQKGKNKRHLRVRQ